jgi:NitT/TauT family transport system permease protein
MNVTSNGVNEPIATPVGEEVVFDTSDIRRRRILINTLRVLFLVVIIGGWELASRVGIIDPFFWGRPSGIWAQIVTWVTQGTAQGPLWEQILVTLEETVLGFIIGVLLGVIFGVVLGRNHFLADVLGPYIKAANSIPRVVLGSIFVIGLGLGMQSKVALAVVLVFFIVFFNAFQGVREADRNLIANARILGASPLQLTTQVIIPSALTWIIASLHTSFSFALVGAVVGEFLGSTQGLGLLIQNAQSTFNANGVFAAMTILAVVALITEALVTMLENRLIRWRPNTVNEGTI